MKLSVKVLLIDTVELPFKLPNSVCVAGGSIYVSSGLNNAVYISNNSEHVFSLFVGGACGIGKYRFREPVFAYAESNELFVCDWHNHRVVKYVDGAYVTEAGMLGANAHIAKSFLRMVKNFGVPGSYIHAHFSNAPEIPLQKIRTSWLRNLLYFLCSIFRLKAKRFHYMQKPNGVCSIGGNIVVTQKNGARLDVMTRDLAPLSSAGLPCDGRVGNITSKNGINLVVVESSGKVFRVSDSYEFDEVLLHWERKNPKPFCAIALSGELVATIAIDTLYFFDLGSGSQLSSYVLGGELHGLDSDGGNIYVLDRMNAKLHVLSVTYD